MSERTGHEPGYGTLLAQLDEMRGKSGRDVHARISIAVRVFDDADFRANLNIDDFGAAEELDKRFRDLDVMGDAKGIFNTLRHMLKAFPDVADWGDGDLSGLHKKFEAKRREQQAKPMVLSSTPQRRSAKVRDLEQARQETKEVRAELRQKARLFTRAKTELETLQEENQRLREENAELRGRVAELERLTSTVSVA